MYDIDAESKYEDSDCNDRIKAMFNILEKQQESLDKICVELSKLTNTMELIRQSQFMLNQTVANLEEKYNRLTTHKPASPTF